VAILRRFRLVNVAIGITVAAILCLVWACSIPVKEGKATVYSFTGALALFAGELSEALVLAALCAWALTGIAALVGLCCVGYNISLFYGPRGPQPPRHPGTLTESKDRVEAGGGAA